MGARSREKVQVFDRHRPCFKAKRTTQLPPALGQIPEQEPEVRYPNKNKKTGAGGPFMLEDPVVAAPEPCPRNFVGLVVLFDLHRPGGVVSREKGEVTAQKWLGVTERGRIPEYELKIRGLRSGRSVLARVTRDHVSPI